MKKSLFSLIILVISLFSVSCQKYDHIVEKDEMCDQKWGNYEAQLQRRADLIPNLVAVVKASAAHENQTLKEVMEARASATQIKLTADDLTDKDKVAAFEAAQSQLKGSLSRLMMVQETYPELKANQNFTNLQIQIEGTENRILRSREEYNAAVGSFNTALKKVEGKAVNAVTGQPFKPRVYFSASEKAKEAPVVDFADKK